METQDNSQVQRRVVPSLPHLAFLDLTAFPKSSSCLFHLHETYNFWFVSTERELSSYFQIVYLTFPKHVISIQTGSFHWKGKEALVDTCCCISSANSLLYLCPCFTCCSPSLFFLTLSASSCLVCWQRNCRLCLPH